MRKFFAFLLPMLLLFCFTMPSIAWAVEDDKCWTKQGIGWAMNSEADMAHYTVYYGVTEPTDETLINFADSVNVPHPTAESKIDPANPTVRLIFTTFPSMAATERFYFGVTASDKSGNESPLSKIVSCLYKINSDNIPRIFFRAQLE